MEIPKPAVSKLVGGDQICNDGEMALLVTLSSVNYSVFHENPPFLEAKFRHLKKCIFLYFFLQNLGFSGSLCTFFLQTGGPCIMLLMILGEKWNYES